MSTSQGYSQHRSSSQALTGAPKTQLLKHWKPYTKYGGVCHPFVPFKAPLRKAYESFIEPDQRWTPEDVIEAFPTLGLVIDLTRSKDPAKYYVPHEFTSRGVEHLKFPVPGLGYTSMPSERLVSKFISSVRSFLQENPDKLIGVHCTHGLNRTGYFICRYLIDEMKMSPENAIDAFQTARGHQMLYPDAVNHLYPEQRRKEQQRYRRHERQFPDNWRQ